MQSTDRKVPTVPSGDAAVFSSLSLHAAPTSRLPLRCAVSLGAPKIRWAAERQSRGLNLQQSFACCIRLATWSSILATKMADVGEKEWGPDDWRSETFGPQPGKNNGDEDPLQK
eukprot:s3611_g7.t1